MIENSSKALLIVDTQNRFLHPSADNPLNYFDTIDIGGDSLVEELSAFLARQTIFGHVIFVITEDTDTIAPSLLKCRRVKPNEHAEIPECTYRMPRNLVPSDAHLISKKYDSGFSDGSFLDSVLKELGVDDITVTGLNTDCCVLETAHNAKQKGYKASIDPSLCRDPKTGADEQARTDHLQKTMAKKNIAAIDFVDLRAEQAAANLQKPSAIKAGGKRFEHS